MPAIATRARDDSAASDTRASADPQAVQRARDRRCDHAAAAVTLIAAAIRLWGAGAQALFLDEFTSWQDAQLSASRIWHMGDGLPPTYELLLHGLLRIGLDSDWWLRLPSVVAGALTVGLIYLVGRRVENRVTGLIAAALLAINPLAVWYSQEARPYALLTFCAVGGTLSLLAIQRDGRMRSVVGYAVWNTLGLGLHYYYAFVVLAHAGMIGFDFLSRVERRKQWLAAAALTGLGALVWVPELIHDIAAQTVLDAGRPDSRLALAYVALTFVGGFSLGPPFRALHADAWYGVPIWNDVAPHLVTIVAAVGVLAALALLALRQRLTVERCLVLLLIAAPIAGPWLGSSIVGDRPRYALPALPFVLLWAASANRTNRGRLASVLLVLLAAFELAGLSAIHAPRYAREDTRSAAAWVGQHAERALVLLVGETACTFERYATETMDARCVEHLDRAQAAVTERPAVGDVFLVASRPWTVDPQATLQAMLDRSYAFRDEAAFAGVTVRWYSPGPP